MLFLPQEASATYQWLPIIINVVSLVCGAVWVVSKINTKTSLLSQSIDHLSKSVDKLADKYDGHSGQISQNNVTLAQHEMRLNNLDKVLAEG